MTLDSSQRVAAFHDSLSYYSFYKPSDVDIASFPSYLRNVSKLHPGGSSISTPGETLDTWWGRDQIDGVATQNM